MSRYVVAHLSTEPAMTSITGGGSLTEKVMTADYPISSQIQKVVTGFVFVFLE